MKQNILKQIDEAIASKNTSEENKLLLTEVKHELKKAKTEKRITQIVAILVKIFTGFLDND